jgi:hypothetical protein
MTLRELNFQNMKIINIILKGTFIGAFFDGKGKR